MLQLNENKISETEGGYSFTVVKGNPTLIQKILVFFLDRLTKVFCQNVACSDLGGWVLRSRAEVEKASVPCDSCGSPMSEISPVKGMVVTGMEVTLKISDLEAVLEMDDEPSLVWLTNLVGNNLTTPTKVYCRNPDCLGCGEWVIRPLRVVVGMGVSCDRCLVRMIPDAETTKDPSKL